MKVCFRKEIPCPHCGFDATWYKRDVKMAKRLVQDFWKKTLPQQVPVPAPAPIEKEY